MSRPIAVLMPVLLVLLVSACATPMVVSSVRKNIVDLSPAELTAFEEAIAAMKSNPADPLSFQSLANVHASTCPHGNWYFLPWHRAYLQHFEQVLKRQPSGAALMLPYWDWSTTQSVPASFQVATSPLFDATRPPPVVLGSNMIGPARITAILAIDDFETFGSTRPNITPYTLRRRGSYGELEAAPHNHVHAGVGCAGGTPCGNMASVPTSALDPLFWLHHANIDRLWAMWQKCHPGGDPTLASWRDMEMTFPAVGSLPALRRVSDVVALGPLKYTYSGLGAYTCPGARSPVPGHSRAAVAAGAMATADGAGFQSLQSALSRAEGGEVELGASTARTSASAERPGTVRMEATPLLREVAAELVRDPGASRQLPHLFVRISDIDVSSLPQTAIIKVYVNNPGATAATESTDRSYLGAIALFGFDHQSSGHDGAISAVFDFTPHHQALLADGGQLSLTVAVAVPARAAKADAALSFGAAALLARPGGDASPATAR